MLTQARLRELLSYDSDTGFFWRIKTPRHGNPWRGRGRPAGSVDSNGYRVVLVAGRLYRAGRLAWFYIFGQWPTIVDHKDGNKDNNALSNLRLATASENNWNRRTNKKFSSTGLKGAHRYSDGRGFRAEIRRHGRRINLGNFKTAEEAHAAYCRAAEELHGEFARFT
jgi:hypothetical protein